MAIFFGKSDTVSLDGVDTLAEIVPDSGDKVPELTK